MHTHPFLRRLCVLCAILAGSAWAMADAYWSENPINRPIQPPVTMTALVTSQPPSFTDIASWTPAFALAMERYDASAIRTRPAYQHVQAYVQWDPTTLYLAFAVADRDHVNDKSGEMLWDGDCVQIAIEKNRIWQEFLFALTPRGPEAFAWEYAPVPEQEYRLVGKRVPAGVKLHIAREANRTLYFAAVPCAELHVPALKAGDDLRLNIVTFDRTSDGPNRQDCIALAEGVAGPKFLAPFAHLTLVESAKAMRPITGPSASLLPNPSFELGDARPTGWRPNAQRGAQSEWSSDAASSGCRSLQFTVSGQKESATWELGRFTGLKPDTMYTISARSRSNKPAGFFRIRFSVDGKGHLVALHSSPEWKTTTYTFSSGKATDGWLTVESTNYHGDGTLISYVDDLILREGVDAEQVITRREVACLTDTLTSTTVQSLRALYPGRSKCFDISSPLPWEEIRRFEKLVVIPHDPATMKRTDWDQVRTAAAAGNPVFLDLTAYAVLTGATLETQSLPADSPWDAFQKQEKAQQTTEASQAAAKAEEALPIPLAVVTKESDLTAGFPAGSEIPWFGRNDNQFVQRQLAVKTLPADAEVVATSSLGGGAVFLRHPLGKGCLYAADILSLGEMTMEWADRGSYNKYIPLQNALGHGLRYGLYWNRRVRYQEYVERMKALAEQYPALTLSVEGFASGYNRYALCIGNPKGPVYLYTGMMHARGEYRSGLYGLYAFAAYLGKHAHESPLKERLQQIAIKIVPVVVPELYEGNSFDYKGPETPLPRTLWNGEVDDIRLVIQQHHGVGPLMVAFGSSLGHGHTWAKAIHQYATQRLYETAPTVIWDYNNITQTGPQAINMVSVVCQNPPSWDAYFTIFPHHRGLAGVQVQRLHAARLNVLSEHSIYGVSPAFADFGVPVREYQSALLTDQSITFLLSSVLVDDPGEGK
jgi:hypothetical protein